MAAWYESKGYLVLARNFRSRRGEIDVIAARPGLVVFCEVKARTTSSFGSAEEAVTPLKQLRLRRAAADWLALHPGKREIRFDVAAVNGTSTEIIEDAF